MTMFTLGSSLRTIQGQTQLLPVRELWAREVEILKSPTFEPPSHRTFEDWCTLGGKYATVAAGGKSYPHCLQIHSTIETTHVKVLFMPYWY